MSDVLVNPYADLSESPDGESILVAPVRNDRLRMTPMKGQSPRTVATVGRLIAGGEVSLARRGREYDFLWKSGLLIRSDGLPRPVYLRLGASSPERARQSAGGEIETRVSRPPFIRRYGVPLGFLRRDAPRWARAKNGFWVPAPSDSLPDGRDLSVGPWDHEDARRRFKANGYVPLPQLIPAAMAKLAGDYYLRCIREGWFAFDLTSRRFFANDALTKYVHVQATALISAVLGRHLRPSFSFMGSYVEQGTLRAHKDYTAARYVVSLLIDYRPRPRAESPWPVSLELSPRETVRIRQRPGDGLLYLGPEITHSRDPLPKGHQSTSIFLFYVDEGDRGADV